MDKVGHGLMNTRARSVGTGVVAAMGAPAAAGDGDGARDGLSVGAVDGRTKASPSDYGGPSVKADTPHAMEPKGRARLLAPCLTGASNQHFVFCPLRSCDGHGVRHLSRVVR